MRMKNVLIFFTAGTLLALLSAPSLAAKFYRWQDEQGVTHYTVDPPPEGIEAQEVRTYNSSSSDQPDALRRLERQREQAAEARETEREERENPAQVFEDRCEVHRQNLSTLQEDEVVATQDPDTGEQRILDQEERARMLDETRAALELCEGTQ